MDATSGHRLERLRAAVGRQLAGAPAGCRRAQRRGRALLPGASRRAARERTSADGSRRAPRSSSPWLQGPFLLGGDLLIGGAWRNDQRWMRSAEPRAAS